MKRTFIGVKIKPEDKLLKEIGSLRLNLKNERIKWAELSNLHVTLAFIGDTEDDLVRKIGTMLSEDLKCSGKISFSLTGFGIFRNINDPRILYTSIEKPYNLIEAHSIVLKGLAELGVKLEERNFNPHLTIGRIKEIKEKEKLSELIKSGSGKEFQKIEIQEVIYYESILRPEGALYKPLCVIPVI